MLGKIGPQAMETSPKRLQTDIELKRMVSNIKGKVPMEMHKFIKTHDDSGNFYLIKLVEDAHECRLVTNLKSHCKVDGISF